MELVSSLAAAFLAEFVAFPFTWEHFHQKDGSMNDGIEGIRTFFKAFSRFFLLPPKYIPPSMLRHLVWRAPTITWNMFFCLNAKKSVHVVVDPYLLIC